MAEPLNLRLSVRPMRGQMLAFDIPGPLAEQPTTRYRCTVATNIPQSRGDDGKPD